MKRIVDPEIICVVIQDRNDLNSRESCNGGKERMIINRLYQPLQRSILHFVVSDIGLGLRHCYVGENVYYQKNNNAMMTFIM